MFSAVVASLLTRYLSTYLKGVRADQLDISARGEVELRDVQLREEPFSELLAVTGAELRGGRVGRVAVQLQGWGGISVQLDRLTVLVAAAPPRRPTSAAAYEAERVAAKRAQLARSVAAEGAAATSSALGALVARLGQHVLEGVEARVTELHVRYEDAQSDPLAPFVLGVRVGALAVERAPSAGTAKVVVVRDVALYGGRVRDALTGLASLASGDDMYARLDAAFGPSTSLPSALFPSVPPAAPAAAAAAVAGSAFATPLPAMVGPFDVEARVEALPSPAAGALPELRVSVVVPPLSVTLHQQQLHCLVAAAWWARTAPLRLEQRRDRPTTRVEGHALEWWTYVRAPTDIHTRPHRRLTPHAVTMRHTTSLTRHQLLRTISHRLRDRRRRHSLAFLAQRRQLRGEYISLHAQRIHAKARGLPVPPATAARLQELEDGEALSVADVVLFRSAAEALAATERDSTADERREAGAVRDSWARWLWSAVPHAPAAAAAAPPPAPPPPAPSLASLTADQKRFVYRAIGMSAAEAAAPPPLLTSVRVVQVKLQSVEVALVAAQRPLLAARLSLLVVKAEDGPAGQRVHASLETLELRDTWSAHTHYPIILRPRTDFAAWLTVDFVAPSDAAEAQRLRAEVSACDVVLNLPWADQVRRPTRHTCHSFVIVVAIRYMTQSTRMHTPPTHGSHSGLHRFTLVCDTRAVSRAAPGRIFLRLGRRGLCVAVGARGGGRRAGRGRARRAGPGAGRGDHGAARRRARGRGGRRRLAARPHRLRRQRPLRTLVARRRVCRYAHRHASVRP